MTIGAGNRVDGASFDLKTGQDPNSTYRKRATSKSARQMRLEATEKRLAAMVSDLIKVEIVLTNAQTNAKQEDDEDPGSTTEDEPDYTETDSDRRQLMGDIKM